MGAEVNVGAQSGCTIAQREETFVTTDDLVREAAVNPSLDDALELAAALQANLNAVVLGTPDAVVAATTAVLAAGHLLIEDVPGVGKTMLAKAVAVSIGTRLARIQGHPDLLPSDITGVSIYSASSETWEFRPGPVFAHVVLFDELNRTPPRSQAALLEAMEERQVSVDGVSHALPEPFFVVATQNPHEQIGTYGLPESQLDRFLMRVSLGYPDPASERRLLLQGERRELLQNMPAVLSPAELLSLQRAAHALHVAAPLLDYVQALIARTRTTLRLGLSPRAAQGLVRAAQAWALIAGETAVLPEHVQAVLPAVAAHRLERQEGDSAAQGAAIAQELIKAVALPL